MTIELMREWVIKAYPGSRWKNKIKNTPDDQIIAIYHNLVKQGRIKGA